MTGARRYGATAAKTWMLCAATWLGVASCQSDVERGMEKANDLLYRKQYVESERLYRKLLRRIEEQSRSLDEADDQARMQVLDRLGKINALYLHDHPQAIAYYQMLVRYYPKTEQSLAARATIADIYHHKLGDLQAAIDAYQKLVAEAADRGEGRWAQLQIVGAYVQLKNYEQARTEAESLINRWPQSDEARQARFQIASSYYVEGRYAEAIATYESLLSDKPEKSLVSLVLFELGNCFQELGEPDRALAYYYACLPDHPNPTLVQHKIHRVRLRIHRSKPAEIMDIPEYADAPAAPIRVRRDEPVPKPAAMLPGSPRPPARDEGAVKSSAPAPAPVPAAPVPPPEAPSGAPAPTPEAAAPLTP